MVRCHSKKIPSLANAKVPKRKPEVVIVCPVRKSLPAHFRKQQEHARQRPIAGRSAGVEGELMGKHFTRVHLPDVLVTRCQIPPPFRLRYGFFTSSQRTLGFNTEMYDNRCS
ncbi:hypothetical protein CDAR_367001 [Caerostris darwini]|uniref:Uncharacterized protein n=1 Tax=Caerostris darwini TaxID=1538125 RepID=A0AAV4WMY8_9ARAC|nr:hypothetical protein CDAR_367001 [Caerostris darwini]